MKLCIPVKLPEGLDSQIEPHLPNAAFLTFFDTETRSVDAVSLREPKPGDEQHMNFDAEIGEFTDEAGEVAVDDAATR